MEAYLREIARTPLLTRQQEKDLARRIHGDDEADALAARNRLVSANLRLVVSIARHYVGHGLGIEDLIAEGNLGLFIAAERYDPARGTRFSTYATWWVRQAVAFALKRDARLIRVPSYVLEMLAKWLKQGQPGGDALLSLLPGSRQARSGGMAAREIRIKKAAEYIGHARKAINVSPFPVSDPDSDRTDEPADPRVPAPRELAADKEDVAAMAAALARLAEEDERAAMILRLRFGMGGGEPMTLKEIGARLGVTRECVRQNEGNAISRLRQIMGVDVPACRLSGWDRALARKAAAKRAKRAREKAGV